MKRFVYISYVALFVDIDVYISYNEKAKVIQIFSNNLIIYSFCNNSNRSCDYVSKINIHAFSVCNSDKNLSSQNVASS